MGQDAVAGVGGTRLCDWWFTDEAVLIDTSGRYTTQDSDAAVDRVGWEAFLDLLKRTRVRQPLNGVLVAIGLNDIARAPQAERIAHARAIRSRVKELEAKLGARMPVYLLFTKADLIAGFTEFFGGLDRDRRDQVWGTTFPLQDRRSWLRRIVRRRIPCPGRQVGRPVVIAHAGRARRRSARHDRRFSGPDRQPGATADGLHPGGVRRLQAGARADAARGLFHLRHAGGHADRPADRVAVACVRPGSAPFAKPAAGTGEKLFSRRIVA